MVSSNLLVFLTINWPQCVKSKAKFGGLVTISRACAPAAWVCNHHYSEYNSLTSSCLTFKQGYTLFTLTTGNNCSYTDRNALTLTQHQTSFADNSSDKHQQRKPVWILLKQETVSGSGISWAICKSAPRSRQTTTPAPHHSVSDFTGQMPFLPPKQRQSTEGKK